MSREHINPLLWHQSVGFARQSCARFFRDGRSPTDAMRAFGVEVSAAAEPDWGKAVDAIAEVLSAQPQRQAA
jgi:hypothetical protein